MEILKNEVELKPSAGLLENSMYLEISRSKAKNLEKMIEFLNKRKELLTTFIGDDVESLGEEYEQNEKRILLLKTDYELAKHHRTLIGIKNEAQGYTEKATEILEEMDNKWNEVMAKAKKEAVRKKDISSILNSKTDDELNCNIDIKINHYLQLKSMVYNTGSLKKV